jgi:hypothetical protein
MMIVWLVNDWKITKLKVAIKFTYHFKKIRRNNCNGLLKAFFNSLLTPQLSPFNSISLSVFFPLTYCVWLPFRSSSFHLVSLLSSSSFLNNNKNLKYLFRWLFEVAFCPISRSFSSSSYSLFLLIHIHPSLYWTSLVPLLL